MNPAAYPRADLHAHFQTHDDPPRTLSYAAAVAHATAISVRLGVTAEEGAHEPIHDDASLLAFLEGIAPHPLYAGLQVTSPDWPARFDAALLARLDYTLADALIMPWRSRHLLLWLPTTRVADDEAEAFMEAYLAHHEAILQKGLTIWANATMLPLDLAARYEELWSPERRQRLIERLLAYDIAVEINSTYALPGRVWLDDLRDAGVRFTFGSNAHVDGVGQIATALRLAAEASIPPDRIWVPAREFAAIPPATARH